MNYYEEIIEAISDEDFCATEEVLDKITEEVSRIDFEGLEATIKDAEKVFRAIKNLFGG